MACKWNKIWWKNLSCNRFFAMEENWFFAMEENWFVVSRTINLDEIFLPTEMINTFCKSALYLSMKPSLLFFNFVIDMHPMRFLAWENSFIVQVLLRSKASILEFMAFDSMLWLTFLLICRWFHISVYNINKMKREK